ncbi:hypothetical protein CALCODRAFT_207077 [Calocera cornea HHB12733]|uniref:Uncharacterized protein n=1 Tax=Calocera cornea HHB12733 TaxID=1353952 RepID=A0A165K290_9BASI|nr:hypothetical protein CALCODRAFT_207077 [Calocera cornea HHB12733]
MLKRAPLVSRSWSHLSDYGPWRPAPSPRKSARAQAAQAALLACARPKERQRQAVRRPKAVIRALDPSDLGMSITSGYTNPYRLQSKPRRCSWRLPPPGCRTLERPQMVSPLAPLGTRLAQEGEEAVKCPFDLSAGPRTPGTGVCPGCVFEAGSIAFLASATGVC